MQEVIDFMWACGYSTGILTLFYWVVGIIIAHSLGWKREEDISDSFALWIGIPFVILLALTILITLSTIILEIWK